MSRGVKKDRLTFEVELRLGAKWRGFEDFTEAIHNRIRYMLASWLNERIRLEGLVLVVNPVTKVRIKAAKPAKQPPVRRRRNA